MGQLGEFVESGRRGQSLADWEGVSVGRADEALEGGPQRCGKSAVCGSQWLAGSEVVDPPDRLGALERRALEELSGEQAGGPVTKRNPIAWMLRPTDNGNERPIRLVRELSVVVLPQDRRGR